MPITDPAIEPILAAAKRWVERCLLTDSSVFTDKEIWTPGVTAEFQTLFVENPLEGAGNFISKLETQLAPGSAEVKQYAAELLWVLFLFPTKEHTSPGKKEQHIRKVWAWSGEAFPEPAGVEVAFENGVGNPGIAFNTGRWREVVFLHTFSTTIKAVSREEQLDLLADPWKFAAWLDSVEGVDGRQMRHVLLYLLFPEQFERISSSWFKRGILEALEEEIANDSPEPPKGLSQRGIEDWRLLQLRQALAKKLGNNQFEFWDPPIAEQWMPQEDEAPRVEEEPASSYGGDSDPAAGSAAERQQFWWLNANPKVWDFKALGVGGTEVYTALNEAGNKRQKYKYFEQVRPGDQVIGYLTTPTKAIVSICEITKGFKETDGVGFEFKKLEDLDNPITWEELQNLPQLEECEPIQNNQGSLFRVSQEEFEFLRAAADEHNRPSTIEPYSREDALADLFMPDEEFDAMIKLLRRKKNIILQGPPGVGKTFVARRLAYTILEKKDNDRAPMVQFHQSYAYEDFIQGYRPDGKGGFRLRSGTFYTFCKRAQLDPEHPYFLIIDEINRGNLSKIFGELMMLIEPDKRGEEFALQLTYSELPEDTFYVPENVHLIGTMNTADRSLSMVDYALRRRFAFIDLTPQLHTAKFSTHLEQAGAAPELISRIVNKVGALNEKILSENRELGFGYRIGHSFFCPGSGETADENWFRMVVESEIAPLIREYWLDEPDKARDLARDLLL